jgi:hypothetical protein
MTTNHPKLRIHDMLSGQIVLAGSQQEVAARWRHRRPGYDDWIIEVWDRRLARSKGDDEVGWREIRPLGYRRLWALTEVGGAEAAEPRNAEP